MPILDQAILEQIVRAAASSEQAPYGLTHLRVVKDTPVGAVKVRVYASEQEAQEREALLCSLAGKIHFPEILGRCSEALVFRYLEMDRPADPGGEAECFELGCFLAVLNSTQADVKVIELDQEFAGWMERFGQMRLIPRHNAQKAAVFYQRIRPPELALCLDYWDAMPRNFGWHQGAYTLLDEKHIRPSFPGVGLVKPSFLLPAHSWRQVRAGYASRASLDGFDRYRAFLEFYYLAAALYFYSLISAAGRAALGRNGRFLDYRDRLVQIVTGGRWQDALASELDLYSAFPQNLPGLLKRRLFLMSNRLPKKPIPAWGGESD